MDRLPAIQTMARPLSLTSPRVSIQMVRFIRTVETPTPTRSRRKPSIPFRQASP